MNKLDLEHFKKLILEKREEALLDMGYLEVNSMSETSKDQAGNPSSFPDHMAEQGTDANDREKAFCLASRESVYLHQLDKALERIKKRMYGTCRSCGREIPPERLEAVPTTTLCMGCKNGEKKGRGRKLR